MLQALKENKFSAAVISWLSLFTSIGTLLCCALPSTLVLLGLGSTVAGFLGKYPELIWLSENKGIIFTVSFLMIGLSLYSQKVAANRPCPIDKKDDCERTKNWSKYILYFTIVVNLIGVVYAYVL